MSENVPELRFPEFDEEWDDKFLVDIATINPKSNNLPDNFVYIDLESVESGVLKKENYITKNEAPSRAQRVLNGNDILYQTVRPYQKNNLFFEGNNSKKYVASTGYAQIRTLKNNPKFLYQSLHTERFVNRVLARCTGTSYPAINTKDLEKIHIKNPSIEEQNKIASFLSKVDEKIGKLEEKQQIWETYKKGIMQQIFNQKLRFKDENGEDYPDWDEKKLGDILKSSTSNLSINNLEDNNGKYPLYGASGFLKNINFFEKDEKYIAIVKDGSGVGKTFLCNGKSSILGTLQYLIANDKNRIEYIYYLIKFTVKFKKYIIGSSIPHIYFKEYSKENVNVASISEQTKIANFLTAIDAKIEEINRELKLNREFKKGLLQKMFC